jgi:hypothetical protein
VVERYRLLDYGGYPGIAGADRKEWPSGGANLGPNYRANGLQFEFAVEDEGLFNHAQLGDNVRAVPPQRQNGTNKGGRLVLNSGRAVLDCTVISR